MRGSGKLVAGLLLGAVASTASAEIYQVYVERVSKDLYRTSGDVLIETRCCDYDTSGVTAVLDYAKDAPGNEIIWDDGSCRVKRIYSAADADADADAESNPEAQAEVDAGADAEPTSGGRS